MNKASKPRQTLLNTVTEALLDRIADGDLQPGDLMQSESALASEFGVSKPVIREALRQLSMQNLIEIRQGRQSLVLGINSKPLMDFFALSLRATDEGLYESIECRRAIETDVARLAALRATNDDRSEILRKLGDLKVACTKITSQLAPEASANGGPHVRQKELNSAHVDAWVRSDVAFHLAIARACKNSLMLRMIEGLEGSMRFTMGEMIRRADRAVPAEVFDRHQNLASAICAGEPEEAARAMREHFSASETRLTFVLSDRNGGA